MCTEAWNKRKPQELSEFGDPKCVCDRETVGDDGRHSYQTIRGVHALQRTGFILYKIKIPERF